MHVATGMPGQQCGNHLTVLRRFAQCTASVDHVVIIVSIKRRVLQLWLILEGPQLPACTQQMFLSRSSRCGGAFVCGIPTRWQCAEQIPHSEVGGAPVIELRLPRRRELVFAQLAGAVVVVKYVRHYFCITTPRIILEQNPDED